jgi:hypothetical protein
MATCESSEAASQGPGRRFTDSCFHRVVLLDVLNPAAPFVTFLRKLVLLNGMIIAIVSAVSAVFNVAVVLAADPTPANYMQFVCQLTLVATSVAAYAMAQRRGDVSDVALSVQMWGNAAGALIGQLSTGIFPYNMGIASYAIFAAICELPFRNLFFIPCVGVYVVYSYNTAALMTGNELWSAAGYNKPTMSNMLRNYAFGLVVFAVPVVASVLHMLQHRRLLAAAEAANALSGRVAEMLRRYDTDGVAELLEEYSAAPDHDAHLLESYEALVANLNRYRPHLPNWLIKQRDGRDGSSSRASSRPSSAGLFSPAASNTLLAPDARGWIPSAGDAAGSRRPVSADRRPVSADRGPVSADRQRPADTGAADDDAPSPREDWADDVLDLDAIVSDHRVTHTVAYALVDFRVGAAMSPEEQASTVSDFIDMVHYHASTMQGALHCFVGDTVQLSWNAAMKCSQPEVRAARFLCKLKACVVGNTPAQEFSVAAALASGQATSQFGGSGQVSAFVLSLPWRAKLLACFALAKRHRAFVCSDVVVAAAGAAIVTRPVELLSVKQHGENSAMVVHEVLAERLDQGNNDEWLYLLCGPGGATGKEDADVIQLCVDGFYADALAAMGPPSDNAPPLVASLRARVEAAVANPGDTFATVLCTCDNT